MEMCLKLNSFEESDKTFDKFSLFTKQYLELLSEYENLSLSDFVKEVISKFNIKQAYFEKEEDIEKTMNIDSLIGSVIDFETNNERATLVDFLENVSLISDIDTEDGQGSSVTIATVHAVKGLEFKVVFVVGLEETIFPLGRARDNPSELEEERRLMYVAITRAREQLYFLNCEVRFLYGKQNYMMPSRFLAEAGVEKPKKVENSNFAFSKAPMPQKFDVIKPKVITQSQMEKKVNDISKFRVGQTVLHPKFGVGIVEEIDSSAKFIDITFGGIGKKTLLIEIAPLKIIKG